MIIFLKIGATILYSNYIFKPYCLQKDTLSIFFRRWTSRPRSPNYGIRRSPVKDHNDMIYWNKSKLYKGGKLKSDTGAQTGYWGDCGATAMAILNLQVYYRYDLIENMKTKLVN